MNHKYDNYYFLYFPQVDSIDEMTSLISQLKDYVPVSAGPKLCKRNKKIEELIITKTSKILHVFIPILTYRVFMCYKKSLKMEPVFSALAASIECTKESNLS